MHDLILREKDMGWLQIGAEKWQLNATWDGRLDPGTEKRCQQKQWWNLNEACNLKFCANVDYLFLMIIPQGEGI